MTAAAKEAHAAATKFGADLASGSLHTCLDVDDPSNVVFRPYLEYVNKHVRIAADMLRSNSNSKLVFDFKKKKKYQKRIKIFS